MEELTTLFHPICPWHGSSGSLILQRTMNVALYALLSTVAVTLLSAVGIAFFLFRHSHVKPLLIPLVSFSTGAILGDVFLHMFPEMVEAGGDFTSNMIIVLVGIVFSFCVEKIIHWRHCHVPPCDGDDHHCHTVGTMTMLGETVHNFIDGVVIAASFLVSIPVGIASTIAIIFHEVPHEIGNFAVLLHSGFDRAKALRINLLSGSVGILGTLAVFLASQNVIGINMYLLPFAAGNLLYIAGSDLIPELHKQSKIDQSLLQLAAMILGMLLMYAVLGLE